MSAELRALLGSTTHRLIRNWHLVLVCWLLLFLITPFDVTYPGAGLDPSWRVALNVAVAEHLAFGRDIVFTYGPYAAVSTRTYHPQLAGLAVGGGLLLTGGYVVAALVLLRGRRRSVAVVMSAIAALGLANTDAFSLAYPLVAVVVVRQLLKEAEDADEAHLGWADRMRLVVLAVPFALLPLVKTSAVPVVLVGLAAITVLLAMRRHLLEAATLWLVPLLMTPVLWLVAGQPLGALANYVLESLPIVSGYTQAMAVNGDSVQVKLVVGASLVVVAAMLVRSSLALPERLVLAAVVAATLFLTFKAAFVRQDYHAVLVVFPLAVAAVVAVCLSRSLFWRVPVVLVCVVAVLPLRNVHPPEDKRGMAAHLVDSFTAGPTALAQRVVDPRLFDRRYDEALAGIRAQHRAPRVVPGTDVDMYGIWGSSLLAQDVHWNPRPIFQSYQAYTPSLAQLNLDHLNGPSAPDEVLFSIRAVDGRLPALEDGPSWIPLLEKYKVTNYDRQSNFLEMHRRAKSVPIPVSSSVRLTGSLGHTLALPRSSPGWLARFDIHPTVKGRLRELLWKTSTITITITLAGGHRQEFRFIPEMGRSQFLLSPLVLDAKGMAGLVVSAGSIPGATVPPRVRSIRLDSGKPDGNWKAEYSVELDAVALPAGPG